MITNVMLLLLAIYLACGLLFALPFVLFGVQAIDPRAAHGSWGFRILIIPGVEPSSNSSDESKSRKPSGELKL